MFSKYALRRLFKGRELARVLNIKVLKSLLKLLMFHAAAQVSRLYSSSGAIPASSEKVIKFLLFLKITFLVSV
jgi:hypothetical protein